MRVLITGASSGIGTQTALLAASRGHDVALVARGREGLERTAEAVRSHGVPPDLPPWLAYDPEAVAEALLEALDRPRPEQTVGLAMRAVELIPRRPRDLALTQVARLALRRGGDDPPGRAIWEPTGEAERTVLGRR